MNLHEYQGKQLFREYGLPVSEGFAAGTAQEAVEAADRIGGDEWVVKCQVHAGGRGKAGGVKLVKQKDEIAAFAENCGGTGVNKACIDGPAGLFKDNQKAKDSVEAFNWLLLAVSIIACVIFGIKCSKNLSDENYLGAVGPGAGAVVAGIVMFLSYSIVS